jgi:hypothetical protein
VPAQLHLPLRSTEDFYLPHTRQALHDLCTPLDLAREGDVIAVRLDVFYAHANLTVAPIETAYCLSRESGTTLNPVRVHNLDPERLDAIAKPLVLMQSHGLYSIDLARAIALLDPDRDVDFLQFQVLAMPDFAVVVAHEYDVKGLLEDKITQEVINRLMIAIHITSPNASAHEQVESLHLLHKMLDIANDTWPMPLPAITSGPDGQPLGPTATRGPLVLPDLTDIECISTEF